MSWTDRQTKGTTEILSELQFYPEGWDGEGGEWGVQDGEHM